MRQSSGGGGKVGARKRERERERENLDMHHAKDHIFCLPAPPSPGAGVGGVTLDAIILFQAPFAHSSWNSCSPVTGASVTPPPLTGIAANRIASACVGEVAASRGPCVSGLTERQQVIRASRI
jgi:hypothetical protein